MNLEQFNSSVEFYRTFGSFPAGAADEIIKLAAKTFDTPGPIVEGSKPAKRKAKEA